MAVQKKYNSLRKPADKEKFQAKVGKSYKDMMLTKRGFASDAQRQYLSGYKQGKKDKKIHVRTDEQKNTGEEKWAIDTLTQKDSLSHHSRCEIR